MNFPCFFSFFKSISKPIIKSKKYIPKFARNEKVSEEVIEEKGFLIANIAPIIKAEKIQGTLIFSINLPSKKVTRNNPLMNKKVFIIFLF